MSFQSHALTFIFAAVTGVAGAGIGAVAYVNHLSQKGEQCEVYKQVTELVNKTDRKGSTVTYKDDERMGVKGCVVVSLQAGDGSIFKPK